MASEDRAFVDVRHGVKLGPQRYILRGVVDVQLMVEGLPHRHRVRVNGRSSRAVVVRRDMSRLNASCATYIIVKSTDPADLARLFHAWASDVGSPGACGRPRSRPVCRLRRTADP